MRMYRTTDPKPQIKKLAVDLGVHPEALRGWIRQAEADAGERDDRLTTDERAELVALRKENTQLKRVNDVLQTASAFFASQPGRRRSSTSTRAWGSSPYCGNCTSLPPRTTGGAAPKGSRAKDGAARPVVGGGPR
ncbi:transposase-like protein [Streptomyces pseudovenezuelae]|uniref:Transposase-like protein n=1 Tax=Streptomyces pseudovenezuelae TaxID=67350 RepID=A0ABT6M3T5_9ACTN|nr:transposase-like protein [Streptomyces pseudovenezuelae]